MFHKCRFIVTTECKGSEFCSTRACFSGFCNVNVHLMNVLPLKAHVRHVLVICGFRDDAAAALALMASTASPTSSTPSKPKSINNHRYPGDLFHFLCGKKSDLFRFLGSKKRLTPFFKVSFLPTTHSPWGLPSFTHLLISLFTLHVYCST